MVLVSGTMNTYAFKSGSLSLKLGRMFQELYNDIPSLTHSAPLQVRPQLCQQQDTTKYVSKRLGPESHKILCTLGGFFDRKSDLHKQIHNMHIKKCEY